jgi:16S rRNA (uracil1498-N3)-methyltransferase
VPSNDLLLLIGPEGDFSSSEIEAAIAKDFTPIDLGPTRLRTETAGIFALSVLKNF